MLQWSIVADDLANKSFLAITLLDLPADFSDLVLEVKAAVDETSRDETRRWEAQGAQREV